MQTHTPNVAVDRTTISLRNPEVPDSNMVLKAGYPVVSVVSQVTLSKFRDNNPN
jgi:hypothetical protein